MNNFGYLIRQGFKSIWHNKLMSFACFCALVVGLLLVGLTTLTMADCRIILDTVSDQNEISVYLENEDSVDSVKKALEENSLVQNISYISPEEGLKKMVEQYEDQKELFESLPYNPVPPTFMVTINDLEKINEAVGQFEQLAGVYKVNAPMDFASFIRELRNTFAIVAIVLIIALGAVNLIIISNMTRVSAYSRRTELSIMHIVGATNTFIKIPFFVEGMTIGVISGGVAWLICKVVYENLYDLILANAGIWISLGINNILNFADIQWFMLAVFCIVGALLSALGTVISVGKYIKG